MEKSYIEDDIIMIKISRPSKLAFLKIITFFLFLTFLLIQLSLGVTDPNSGIPPSP